jgi:hypothetical protein
MIQKDHYLEIAHKHGYYASWAIWADEGDKPKSNMGDTKIFDLDYNPEILKQINPEVVMVGLNFSRPVEKERFINFHDSRPQAQDFKIRYAFRQTKYWGAYMTDIIKDFEQKVSGKVASFLIKNKDLENQNVALFQQELLDLKSANPLIIAFGNHAFEILNKYFKNKYQIIKVPHYSIYISKEKYKTEVEKVLRIIDRSDINDSPDIIRKNQEEVINDLKVLQRVYKISPSNEAMAFLMEEGIKSAHQIVQIPEEVFIEKFSKVLGKCFAQKVYREALHIQNIKDS